MPLHKCKSRISPFVHKHGVIKMSCDIEDVNGMEREAERLNGPIFCWGISSVIPFPQLFNVCHHTIIWKIWDNTQMFFVM